MAVEGLGEGEEGKKRQEQGEEVREVGGINLED